MSTVVADLPIIDLLKAKTQETELAARVVYALENTGFLYIDNVDGLDCHVLHQACSWFFGLEQHVKDKLAKKAWNPQSKNVYRGYFPIIPTEPSRKEAFEFARDVDPSNPIVAKGNWFYERSVWPPEDGKFPFKETLQKAYDVLHSTGMEIMRLTAIGLGVPQNAFTKLFQEHPMSTFRLLHYPPWDGPPADGAVVEGGKVVTTPDHTDSDFLTLLSTFDYHGLEMLNSDSEWVEVEPRPDSLVMNIGDAFSRMVGGRFKATRHRVLDIGRDRYSAPFFFSPGFDADIGANFLSQFQDGGRPHVYEHYGTWALETFRRKNFYETRDLLS